MRKHFSIPDLQKGQALLLVVLVMVISLTVGLSAVTRSITNVRTSTQDENSQRAFSAAEAGVQQALTSGVTSGDVPILNLSNNSTSANANITALGGNTQPIVVSDSVPADQGADVWLVNHVGGVANYSVPWPGSTLKIYWGQSDSTDCAIADQVPALEVVVLSGTTPDGAGSYASNAVSNHFVFDPCASRRAKNGFASAGPGGAITGTTFPYSAQFSVTKVLLMRVIPLYASSPIGVDGGNTFALPQQGISVTSTGSAGSGTIQRKLVYFQGYKTLPAELFQYIYFVNPN